MKRAIIGILSVLVLALLLVGGCGGGGGSQEPVPRIVALQTTGDYRSAANGNWNTLATWQSYNGTSWVAATSTPTSASGVITIQNGHTVTVTAAVTVDQVVVESGGQITVNNGVILTVANGAGDDLTVNGSVTVTGTITGPKSVMINNGGTVTVTGTMSVSNGPASLTVNSGGNLNVSTGGSVSVAGNAFMTVSSGGNLQVTGGSVSLGSVSYFYVYGAVTMSGASTLSTTRGNGGNTVYLYSGGQITMSDTASISIGGNANAAMEVYPGGTLIMGPSALVSGGGDFYLDSGGSMSIGSTTGITSAGATGNIQVTGGTRSYNTGANYTYNGIAAQVTGSALSATTPTAATVNSLTIDNAAGVTLTNSVTVNGILTLTNGNVITNANTLIISSTGSVSRTSGHVVGNLRKYVSTGAGVSRTFEIGTASGYNPVTVNFGSVSGVGNLIGNATSGEHPNIGSSTINSGKDVNVYWSLTNSGITFTNCSATFNFNAGDVDGGANTANFIVGKYSAGWTYPAVGTKTSTSTEATGVTSFSDFAVGEGGNQAPVANNQTLSVNSCNNLTVTLTGSDADSDPLTYIISTLPGHGDLYDGTGLHHIVPGDLPYTVLDSGNRTTYDPVDSYSGADSFGFKVNDGTVDSAEATISITVSDNRSTWYLDSDSDLYGNATVSMLACNKPVGYVSNNTDCDDSSTSCNTDCVTDVDTDGIPDCKDTCIDADGDGYGSGTGCLGSDCDETSNTCNVDCVTDVDSDLIPDCKDGCIDPDGDGYGVGAGCAGLDCDETSTSCNVDCVTDVDSDLIPDCKDTCIDADGDGYGSGTGCLGSDCDETSTTCNVDCVTDVDTDGIPDCKDTCIDADGDGYGVGGGCAGLDCDETSTTCNTDCLTDVDSDGIPDCKDPSICADADGDGYGVGAGCAGLDCNDNDNTIYPGAPELSDGKDNDCDGSIDEGTWSRLVSPIMQHILMIQSTAGGRVTEPAGGGWSYANSYFGSYDPGTVVSLLAIPDAGYRFISWTGGPDIIADVDAASTTITMNRDSVITANFGEIPETPETPEIGQHNLTVSSTAGGSVTTPGEGTFAYNASTVLDLVAKADSGHRFVNWTGNVTTIANVNGASTTITMNGSYSIVANFAQIPPDQVTLTISSSTWGSVTTPGEATFTYDEGTVVNLEAEPEESCRFVAWIGDVDDVADVTDASTTITMNDDYSITATFKFGEGCFIATAAYGTPMADEIQILRDFRDGYLLTNPVGKTLVDIYYTASPPIADFITEHPSLKPIVRAGLVPAVAMSTVAVNTTPAEKVAVIGLLVLVSVALAVWLARRRDKGLQHV